MKTQITLVAGIAVLLFGCEDSGAPEAEAPAAVAGETAEDYARRIDALADGQRDAVFIRAIRGAGRECQHVESSAPRAPVNGAPAWTARCERGTEWIIVLGAGGIAQIVSPAELAAAAAAS